MFNNGSLSAIQANMFWALALLSGGLIPKAGQVLLLTLCDKFDLKVL